MNIKHRKLISLVVAMDKNNLIGNKNTIPWKIPGELKRFREITMGNPIIMGRKTHESIGRILDGRENVVLTRNNSYKKLGVSIYNDFSLLLDNYRDTNELFVIGGSEIYKLALPIANKLYITHIHKEYTGDAWFPNIDFSDWNVIEKEDIGESRHIVSHSFTIYERINE